LLTKPAAFPPIIKEILVPENPNILLYVTMHLSHVPVTFAISIPFVELIARLSLTIISNKFGDVICRIFIQVAINSK